jgi:glycosyltransferase involved in cell wall biosynthesis
MKIGILGQDFMNWSGGIDFLRTVTDSLLAVPRAEHAEFYVLIPDSGPRLTWRRFRHRVKRTLRSFGSKEYPSPEKAPSSDMISRNFDEFSGRVSIRHIDIGRRALISSAKRLGLDVVIPALHTLKDGFPCPWVGYAYDFQHKYYPQHFTAEACQSRDEHFAHMLTQAKAVIVNSRAAAADIARFVPQATARVFALPFAPAPNPDWLEDHPEIFSRYAIAAPFFIISNQFWAHKDHATAFEAFRILAAQNPAVSLVCTGSTSGARDPEYFISLMKKVTHWGLDKRVKILGLISKRDQIEIMKNAVAVVQPTLFEGGPGGGAVYDAVSLGIPSLVSDIPVNRELDGPGIVFFPAGNVEALAESLRTQLQAPRTKTPSSSELISAGRRRRAACGAVLWDSIDLVTLTKH